MVRAKWKVTLAATLTCVGLAAGQQPVMNSSKVEASPQMLTVQELGKPSQKCRVLRTWKESDGMIAFEVQNLTTGERMTIVENGPITNHVGAAPGSNTRAMTTRIYHWMQGNTPSPGTPMPSPSAVVTAPPVKVAVEKKSEMAAAAPKAETQTAKKDDAAAPKSGKLLDHPIFSDWHMPWAKADDNKTDKKDVPEKKEARKPETQDARKIEMPPKVDLPQAASGDADDPLKDPFAFIRKPLDEKLNEKKDETAKKDEKPAPDLKTVSATSDTLNTPAVTATPSQAKPEKSWGDGFRGMFSKPKSVTPPMQPTAGQPQAMLGSASVIAAGVQPGQVYYVPVPMMTLPAIHNQQMMAGQPQYATPQHPQPPSDDVANSFTVVQPMRQAPQPQASNSAMSLNAFGPPSQAGQNHFQAPNAPVEQQLRQVQATQAGNPVQAAGYPQSQAVLPASYASSMQPSQTMPLYTLDGGARGTSGRSAAPAQTPDLPQMLLVLRNSDYPSHRESAAEGLSHLDWRIQPIIVDALMQAAKSDPAATVRAACVRSLGAMNVNTLSVTSVLEGAKTDTDARVRQEAEQILARFAAGSSASRK